MRINLLLFLFISALSANIEIFATKAYEKNNTIYVNNPLIIYNNTILQAAKGKIFNNKKIYLDKNVTIFYGDKSMMSADSLTAYTSKNIKLNDIFYYDKKMQGWIKADSSHAYNDYFYFKKLYFSTCCVEKPDWFMKATSAKYFKKAKTLRLYNITLVINKIPVLYLPFLYLNFNKERRWGLLRPYIGYSENEGILYSQPVYFPTSVNTDLEVTPTIRTLRGRGIYSIFRFVDSPNSRGKVELGYFKDYNSYFQKNNLAHQKHYGYSFLYNRSDIFDKNDSLYMDLKYANDVDYFYLDAYNYKFNDIYLSDKLITSYVNYIYVSKNMLYGIYNKYFIDTSKLSNDSTWQILPQLNFHKFLSKNYHILNSFDFNIYNYYRKLGSNFILSDLLLPVSYDTSLFNNYLKLKLTETLRGGYGFYYQVNSLRSSYLNLSSQIKLYDSLTKVTDTYTHIISPSLTFNIKNYNKYSIHSDLMTEADIQNYISFNLFQIYQSKFFSLTHTLNQIYYLDEKKYSELENIINLTFDKYTVDENNKYSVEKKYVTYNNFKISYNNMPYNVYASHVYQKNTSQALTVGGSYYYNAYKKLYGEYSFDLDNKYTKYWLMGMSMSKKCWNYDFSFKQSRIPVLEENGISYKKNYIFNFSIELVPIGGLNQTFVFKGK